MSERDLPRATGGTAILVIDMINDMAFGEAQQLMSGALRAARRIAELCARARQTGVPVIYVNDNFGQWHSDSEQLIDHCLESAGRDLVLQVLPEEGDYFVTKPQFSGFYATGLPALLPRIGVNRLILTGIAADICVLFTAADAHMREYALWVPADCVASARQDHADWALDTMRKGMAAETADSHSLTLAQWLAADEP